MREQLNKAPAVEEPIEPRKLPDGVSEDLLPRTYVRKDGYAFEYCPRRKMYIAAHILTVLNRYGITKLPYNTEVHHRDYVRTNNANENLVLLKKDEHQKLHRWLNADPSRKTKYSFDEQIALVGITQMNSELI